MHIWYVIGGVSPEYEGWLQIKAAKINMNENSKFIPNGNELRDSVTDLVNRYMMPAGQKYRLYWAENNHRSTGDVYQRLQKASIPRYRRSSWFNTDVWTVREAFHNRSIYNYRRLKPLKLARYLNRKYQQEFRSLLNRPNNSEEQRFKRDFFSTWKVSSRNQEAVKRIIKIFSAYLLLRNLVNHVPDGYRKMYRKLVPLWIDDLVYDLKLLDYKSGLNRLINFKNRINSLKGKPFGTAEFTDQYLIHHVKFLRIFDQKALKENFNL